MKLTLSVYFVIFQFVPRQPSVAALRRLSKAFNEKVIPLIVREYTLDVNRSPRSFALHKYNRVPPFIRFLERLTFKNFYGDAPSQRILNQVALRHGSSLQRVCLNFRHRLANCEAAARILEDLERLVALSHLELFIYHDANVAPLLQAAVDADELQLGERVRTLRIHIEDDAFMHLHGSTVERFIGRFTNLRKLAFFADGEHIRPARYLRPGAVERVAFRFTGPSPAFLRAVVQDLACKDVQHISLRETDKFPGSHSQTNLHQVLLSQRCVRSLHLRNLFGLDLMKTLSCLPSTLRELRIHRINFTIKHLRSLSESF